MKKWIIFLSVSCAICLVVFSFMLKFTIDNIQRIVNLKKAYALMNWGSVKKEDINDFVKNIALFASLAFLLLSHLVFSAVMLISIAMRKITPLSLSENLAAWKEHRQQRKLEKAQAKVAQLQDELKKDE